MSQIDAYIFGTFQPEQGFKEFQLVTTARTHRLSAQVVANLVANELQIQYESGNEQFPQPDVFKDTMMRRLEQKSSRLPSLASVKWDCVQIPSTRYSWISALDERIVCSDLDLNAQATMMREIKELVQDLDGIRATVICSHQCLVTGDVIKVSTCSGLLTHDRSTSHPETLQTLFLERGGSFVEGFRRLEKHRTKHVDEKDACLGSMLRHIAAGCIQETLDTQQDPGNLRYQEVSYCTSEVLKKVIDLEDWEVGDPRIAQASRRALLRGMSEMGLDDLPLLRQQLLSRYSSGDA